MSGFRWEMHPAPHADKDNFVTFDLKNDAIVLPQPLSYYIQNGYTTQAIVTNLQNLGVKFETPQQGGIPSAGIDNSMANFMPRVGLCLHASVRPKGTVIRGGYGEYIYPVPIRNSVRYLTADYPFTASYSQSYTSAAQSPDGLPNYLLRAPQTVVAGLNSANVVNTNSTNALLPGISIGETLAANYPPAHVREANMTIEQPFRDGSVFRVSYVFTHGYNLDQNYQYNNAPSTYVWETATGTTPPTGTYASVATRPYDQTRLGRQRDLDEDRLVQRQRAAAQLSEAVQEGLRVPDLLRLLARVPRGRKHLPRQRAVSGRRICSRRASGGPGYGHDSQSRARRLNRYENYHVDTAIPEHHVTFNGIFDLPVGKGKRFLGNSNRFLDALVGGYQVAFVGQVVSQGFQVAAGELGRDQPGADLRQFRPDQRLPQRRVPSGVSVVQRIHLADRDQRGQERRIGHSRQLHALSRADQQHSRHAELRQQQRDRQR